MPDQINLTEDQLTLKKLQLEVERLEWEQTRYTERLRLSDLKLRSDVRDWYYRVLVAVVSTFVGVLTFLWTQSYQRYSDDLKITAARIQEQDARFDHLLVQLADASPALRVAASDGLSAYVQQRNQELAAPTRLQHYWQHLTNNAAPDQSIALEAQVALRRRQEAVQAVSDRLSYEDDNQVLESLGRLLLVPGTSSAEPVAHANRFLANSVARTFGSLLAWDESAQIDRCDTWAKDSGSLESTTLLLARVQMPFQGEDIQLRFDISKFLAHSYEVKPFVAIQCHLDLVGSRGPAAGKRHLAIQQQLIGQAKALAVTSYVLMRILEASRTSTNLDGVQLVTGTGHDDISLANVSLRRVYLSGTPRYFRCRDCILADVSFQDLDVSNGFDVDGSDVCGAHFQQELKSSTAGPLQPSNCSKFH